MIAVTVEYANIDTVGNKQFWTRHAVDGVNRLWSEMWCFDCEGWQVIEYFMGERECSTCNAWNAWRDLVEDEMNDYFKRYEAQWEADHPPALKYYPVRCHCGTCWESTSPLITRCELCEGVVQESDATLRR